jgi:2OG-Fe(II) oxygenase superfamily
MTALYADEQFAVYDDVLSPEQFASLWDFCQRDTYESLHDRMRSGWHRFDNGKPLWGGSVAWPSVSLEGRLPVHLDLARIAMKFYPTGTPMDGLLEAVKARCPAVTNLIGAEREAWAGVNARPYIYAQGSGLAWHADDKSYSGAFIFYAHPEWNVLWGGELLIGDPATRLHGSRRVQDASEDPKQLLLRVGRGHFVMPKPNRLVFIGSGVTHMMTKVTSAAGNHPRVSVTGFFITPQSLMRMAESYLEQGY